MTLISDTWNSRTCSTAELDIGYRFFFAAFTAANDGAEQQQYVLVHQEICDDGDAYFRQDATVRANMVGTGNQFSWLAV